MTSFDYWLLCEVTVRKWSFIVDGDRIIYIGSLAEPLLILIEGKVTSHINLVCCRLSSENILRPASGLGHYYYSARDLINSSSPISGCVPYQSYNLQNLYQQKIKLFSCFNTYNLHLHLPEVIASDKSIIFSINFIRI